MVSLIKYMILKKYLENIQKKQKINLVILQRDKSERMEDSFKIIGNIHDQKAEVEHEY